MKTMTCKALGGPCDASMTADSSEEMLKKATEHVNEAHPEIVEQMKAMSKDDMDKWNADFKGKWDATPEA